MYRKEITEEHVRAALKHIVEARSDMTIWEFQRFIEANISALGGRGFLTSIGKAIMDGATIEGHLE